MLALKRFAADDSGATAIEYGLIGALMAVVIISVLMALGPKMKSGLLKIGTEMSEPKDLTAG